MSTPALDRATEEVRQQDAAGPLMRTSVPTRNRAHAIVSAALHDPDDDAVAAMAVADGYTLAVLMSPGAPALDRYRRMFDAVRAAILGEA